MSSSKTTIFHRKNTSQERALPAVPAGEGGPCRGGQFLAFLAERPPEGGVGFFWPWWLMMSSGMISNYAMNGDLMVI